MKSLILGALLLLCYSISFAVGPITGTSSNAAEITPQAYGARADGSSHPLSGLYGTLGAAQAVYPFATSLTQEVDYCAVKKASDAAFGAYSSENAQTNSRLNRPLHFPAGIYNFGNDTWLIRNASGIHIFGDGREATTLRSNNTVLAFDGLWFSTIERMTLAAQTTGAVAAFDLDGNVPGHPYTTRGVQGNTFAQMTIDGGNSTYASAICRQGSSGGQGSENLFLNVHWTRAATACYYQSGYNALNNTIVGGNFQGYPIYGIYLVAGSINVFSTGFQSTYGYQQMLNGGYDIDTAVAGTFDGAVISGCRTESLRFYHGASSIIPTLIGNSQIPALYTTWQASHAYVLNDVVKKANTVTGLDALYVVTTAGTSAASEPTWTNGPVTDGAVTWTKTTVAVVKIDANYFAYLQGNHWFLGSVVGFYHGGDAIMQGAGAPEGIVPGPPGTLFLRTDGGTGTTMYVKETGVGGTGWVAK